jgi:hypothetical protein
MSSIHCIPDTSVPQATRTNPTAAAASRYAVSDGASPKNSTSDQDTARKTPTVPTVTAKISSGSPSGLMTDCCHKVRLKRYLNNTS